LPFAKLLFRRDVAAGFYLDLVDLNHTVEERTAFLSAKAVYQMFLVGVPIALAFLHLLLFLFYPRSRLNLYFALFAISIAASVFLNYWQPTESKTLALYLIYLSASFIATVYGIWVRYAD